jgi:NADP-reducing hydrogenase subunit HndB
MPKLTGPEELKQLRERVQKETKVRGETNTRICIGMGTCGIAAGSRETMQAIIQELKARNIEAEVVTVGCVGMCAQEPLVDIEQAGAPRVTYGRVRPHMVPTLIEEHLVNGNIVTKWVVAKGTTI